MHDSSLIPRAPSLGGMLGVGTSDVPAPAVQPDSEFIKAMKQRGVRAIHDAQPEESQL